MPKKIKAVFAFSVWLIALLLCGCNDFYDKPQQFEYYDYREKAVFGDITFSAAVRGGDEKAALDRMTELLESIDDEMSLTRADSAFSRFNAMGANESYTQGYESERVEISASAYELIELSREFYAKTDGALNIAVRPLTELWGVAAGDDGELQLPSYEQINEVKEYCDPAYLKTEIKDGRYYAYKTHPALRIDLGAVAKGFAADRCVEIAKANGVESALINISGNICVIGDWYHPDGKVYERWALGVTSPRPRGGKGGDMCAISVTGGKTIVTSGDYVRYRKAENSKGTLYIPHIINGVTGMPLGVEQDGLGGYVNTKNHIISATVICDNSAEADAYATAVCLTDGRKAAEFLQSENALGILVSEDGIMTLSGVTESDESGEAYFIYKSGDDAYDAYKRYEIEEYRY